MGLLKLGSVLLRSTSIAKHYQPLIEALCFTGVVLKIVTNTDRKIIHFILRVWLIVGYWFIGSSLYRAYEYGYVVTKSGRAHLNESPFLFWFTVSIQLALIGLFTYLFFKKPNLDKVGE